MVRNWMSMVLLCALLLTGCNRQKARRTVILVIPNDYRGRIELVEDETAAVSLDEKADEVTINIPEEGMLRVRDLSVLTEWHRMAARRSDGRVVPVRGFDGDDDRAVMVRPVHATSDKRFVYWLGTRDEMLAATQ